MSRRRTTVQDAQRFSQQADQIITTITPSDVERPTVATANNDEQQHGDEPKTFANSGEFTIRTEEASLAQLELQSLSGGQIADLVHLHLQQQPQLPPERQIQDSSTDTNAVVVPSETSSYCYYDPLDPWQFQTFQERPPVEPGRLDSRLLSLRSQLESFQTIHNKTQGS